MSKALRLSEKWFRFGLWIVAFIFASFLIGLGGTVVQNLPKVEQRYTLEDFIDKPAATLTRSEIKLTQQTRQTAQESLDQARLKHNAARANSATARETFNNWLATRHATQRSDQDPELISRTQELDELKITERQALTGVEAQQQILLDAQQAESHAQSRLRELEQAASTELVKALRSQELRVFGYRLALTLPLLGFSPKNARTLTGRLSGALSTSHCSPSLSNWCRICQATAAMCATSSVSSSPC